MRFILTAASIMLCFGPSAPADEQLPNVSAFAVYPAATELQRVRLARSVDDAARLRAYVEIDGNKLVNKDGVIEPQALPIEQLRQALAPYSDCSAGMAVMERHSHSANIHRREARGGAMLSRHRLGAVESRA